MRRLRSLLRTLAPLFGEGWARALRDRLRGLSDELSIARDADVVLTRVRAALAKIEAVAALQSGTLIEVLERGRADARERLARLRADPTYGELLDVLRNAAERPTFRDGDRPQPAELVRDTLRAAYRRVRKRVRRCGDDPTDAALHDVRIAAKHFRYALETFTSIAGRWTKRVARRVRRLQDVLGEEHDASVVVVRLHEADRGEAAFAAGEIAMVERRAIERARRRWRRRFRSVERAFSRKCPSSGHG